LGLLRLLEPRLERVIFILLLGFCGIPLDGDARSGIRTVVLKPTKSIFVLKCSTSKMKAESSSLRGVPLSLGLGSDFDGNQRRKNEHCFRYKQNTGFLLLCCEIKEALLNHFGAVICNFSRCCKPAMVLECCLSETICFTLLSRCAS